MAGLERADQLFADGDLGRADHVQFGGAGSAGRDDATAARINGLLARIPETERTRWLARADIAAALGFAWGEARFWEAAIDCLSTALSAANAP